MGKLGQLCRRLRKIAYPGSQTGGMRYALLPAAGKLKRLFSLTRYKSGVTLRWNGLRQAVAALVSGATSFKWTKFEGFLKDFSAQGRFRTKYLANYWPCGMV